MGILDIIKIYKSEWQEVNCRSFEEAECQKISEARVVASKYGKSVCLTIIGKGKGFIPLEPIANVEIGDILDPKELQLVNLKYVGDNLQQVKKDILRIRVPEKNESVDIVSFDNPFGI